MKYTKIPTNTFKNLQLNAGVLLESFDVSTQTLSAGSIVGATSGGVSFTAVPSFIDFGEDLDIHLLNSLSTGGFSIQSSDKGKGQFEFEFTGHYSMEDQDKVPFEIYVQEGTAA